ncbi:hypothetical protein [Acetobacterium woodii]|uniref:Type IV pilus assembly protein PilO n=1 Tax=Acetobacterium woodii (strain ATCC 29683 / DSM 1030 / JCM 2381 / KCTC 1655 / WB1) TaxID=931626 RepID=H6LEU1_ACEWD|nr:hypothetical protein [Acetobacterium woodii]AFA49384.1 hypothetical protein Awo_c26280 [Acetobacterium woodii DSM 1030]
MKRNEFGENKTNERPKKDQKRQIEKAIVFVSVLVMVIALLIIPKYQTVIEHQALLAERKTYSLALPDAMSEESYLAKLKNIGEQLDELQKNLPSEIDTIQLYEGIANIAEISKVDLVSVKFYPIDPQIDDIIGTKIDNEFIDKEDKSIIGPDKKSFVRCQLIVICSGNDDHLMAFLNELNNFQPAIRILNYEIEGASEKRMSLKLESYGFQDEKTSIIKEKETHDKQ